MKQLLTLLLLIMGFQALHAQVPKDVTFPITATITSSPASITLTFPNPGNANLLILRRTKGQGGTAWVTALNVSGSNVNTVTDNGVANGQIYEYVIQRTIDNFNAFGYVHVAVNANAVNSRGKILIFVDSTTADALGPELVRLKNDMRGDGWWPIPFHTGPSSTPQSIKSQIVASYNADPTNVKAVLLIGSVPIPYSGDANWDGHPDHAGAWPCDAYYADVNGTWTDVSVNDVTPGRAANVNIPGDGKFDQSYIPTAVELQVGRIDFRRINAPAFGAADAIGLMKRYLDKNHRFRIGDYTVENKALVDDNFGYFSGESFATNGFRNAYPLVGENVVEADFFADTNPQSYLLGYGCGGGWYQGAGGVGSSADFATDSINVVFSNLFGSYFGDWDYEADPFMPSALASRGGILTCAWAGRPHYFSQYLASGETIGYCTKETMNAQFNNGYYQTFAESGAHVALLGDPTLRANVVKPATNLTVSAPNCHTVNLSWAPSADAVDGYHIYRALSQDGPYTRLTTTAITATTYTDNNPPLDTLYYQVRAMKNVTNPGGGTYANNAIGPIKSIVFNAAGGPTVTIAPSNNLSCSNNSVTLNTTANAQISTWSWVGPNNFSSTAQNPPVNTAGTYTVTATDAAGCSGTATVAVTSDYNAPSITATADHPITCLSAYATITVDPNGLSSATITGPGGFFVQGFSATTTVAGTYTITATSATNGCLGNAQVIVTSNTQVPGVTASNDGPITCLKQTAQLIATSNVPGVQFQWSGPCLSGNTATCAGAYTVVVANPDNGCTNSATTNVSADIAFPTLSTANAVITCDHPTVQLLATVAPASALLQWSGPCLVSNNPPTASCAGAYTVTATNANGCTATATALVTEDTQAPNISFPALPTLTCVNPCANFVVPNLPGMEILYLGLPVPPGTAVEICQPGVFPITVRSLTNGCSKDYELVITENILAPSVDAGQEKTLSCNNPNAQLNGSVSPAGSSVLWTGPGFSSSVLDPVVNVAGTYTLTATNPENGCTASDAVTVFSDPSLPTVNPGVSGVLNCANPTVQLSSGNSDPGVSYSWTPAAGLSCTSCSNPVASAPGVYTVVVSVGTCSATGAVEVHKAPDLLVNLDPVQVTCDPALNLCVAVTGGTPPYHYLWSNGATTECAGYTAPATINVKVSDSGGCVVQTPNVVIVAPPAMQLVFLITHESAPNAHDGSVDLTVTGGTAPYTYAWSNGATTQDIINLPGGVYNVIVTDVNGCTTAASVTVNTASATEEAEWFEYFKLSPNPTDGPATLSLKLHQNADIQVEIRDLAGRLMLNKPMVHDTTLDMPLDLSAFPAGLYNVTVRVDDRIFVRKLALTN